MRQSVTAGPVRKIGARRKSRARPAVVAVVDGSFITKKTCSLPSKASM